MAKTPKTSMRDDDSETEELPAGGSVRGDPVPISADDLKTEQEKGGKDPVGDLVEPKGKDQLQTNPVGAREPYPGGPAPDPEDAFEAAHGFRRTPKKEA